MYNNTTSKIALLFILFGYLATLPNITVVSSNQAPNAQDLGV